MHIYLEIFEIFEQTCMYIYQNLIENEKKYEEKI